MMRRQYAARTPHGIRAKGFTLVEAVVVIIIAALVAAGVAGFLRAPVAGYIDAAARADLADTADTALRRMARDIRLALPNSVRVTNDGGGAYYIEFLLTRTGGRYLSTDDTYGTGSNALSFITGNTNTQFDVVGPVSTLPEQQIQPNSDSLVIYNLGQGVVPADAYQAGGQTNRVLITGVSTNASGVTTITMQSNVYANQTNKMPSPYYRFQVITGPVTYRCDPVGNTLTRYWNYTISATQPASVAAMSTGQNALIATGVTGCSFTYSSNSLSSALAVLNIKVTTPNNARGGSVGLFQQVHVDNTP